MVGDGLKILTGQGRVTDADQWLRVQTTNSNSETIKKLCCGLRGVKHETGDRRRSSGCKCSVCCTLTGSRYCVVGSYIKVLLIKKRRRSMGIKYIMPFAGN